MVSLGYEGLTASVTSFFIAGCLLTLSGEQKKQVIYDVYADRYGREIFRVINHKLTAQQESIPKNMVAFKMSIFYAKAALLFGAVGGSLCLAIGLNKIIKKSLVSRKNAKIFIATLKHLL